MGKTRGEGVGVHMYNSSLHHTGLHEILYLLLVCLGCLRVVIGGYLYRRDCIVYLRAVQPCR